ncbi:toxin ParE1/3/4 [Erwinia persicina]|jgi:toxin ParE1/3/4|uniref:Type II toxin-antitoxin system RelE/ParE family toxin n=1 Tax=Erwinia plantamica TaxID=3237104 RepID=A0ABW7CFB7_9GAMM|nr:MULTISPECIES: type II toxin-antitoxin system RelE/ParE family toxin [Erwinia]MCP1436644.1 toxin ParE1/3/4 [Erwinia persicina]MDN4628624.1 type II toxin-antitoxin system RelE/ParE family toxin [Erwinia sp. PsM31]MDN8540034.1 type II toxin-antitoxin system RelE/ParE family toxin [Erwinia sp. BC051422]
MGKYTLTDDAKQDVEEIKAYSMETWNRETAKAYLTGMRLAIQRLADNPGIGEDASDNTWPGVRSWPYERHYIFFVPNPEGVTVVGILHQSRLPKAFKKRAP